MEERSHSIFEVVDIPFTYTAVRSREFTRFENKFWGPVLRRKIWTKILRPNHHLKKIPLIPDPCTAVSTVPVWLFVLFPHYRERVALLDTLGHFFILVSLLTSQFYFFRIFPFWLFKIWIWKLKNSPFIQENRVASRPLYRNTILHDGRKPRREDDVRRVRTSLHYHERAKEADS